jgi:hypothetical protein
MVGNGKGRAVPNVKAEWPRSVEVGRSFAKSQKWVLVVAKSCPTTPIAASGKSIILVPLPHPSVIGKQMLAVFGCDEAPRGHAEVVFDNVRVPGANMLLGEGRGFEIASRSEIAMIQVAAPNMACRVIDWAI